MSDDIYVVVCEDDGVERVLQTRTEGASFEEAKALSQHLYSKTRIARLVFVDIEERRKDDRLKAALIGHLRSTGMELDEIDTDGLSAFLETQAALNNSASGAS